MFYVSLLISVVLTIAAVLIFNIDSRAVRSFMYEVEKSVQHRRDNKKGKISLKKQRDALIGEKRTSFIVRSFNEATEILIRNHETSKIRGIYFLSGITGFFGLVAALLFNNLFLIPSFVIGAGLVPTWVVRLTSNNKTKRLNSDLEVALSGVTTSYIRNDNIILAVEENLVYMEGIVKRSFSKFVNENRMINSNVSLGIQKLQRSIDNPIFHEWCDALYQCQSDRTLKVILFPIINSFSETKSIQQELDTMMMLPLKDTISVAVTVILSIPMMNMLNSEWYTVLTTTVVGQLILGILGGIMVYAINKAISITKPLNQGGK